MDGTAMNVFAEHRPDSKYPVMIGTPRDGIPLTTDEAKVFLLQLADAIRAAEARKQIKTIPIKEVRNAQ